MLVRHGAEVRAQGGPFGSANLAAEEAGNMSILKILDTEEIEAKAVRLAAACVIL